MPKDMHVCKCFSCFANNYDSLDISVFLALRISMYVVVTCKDCILSNSTSNVRQYIKNELFYLIDFSPRGIRSNF